MKTFDPEACPVWQMDDAYGDIDSQAWQQSEDAIKAAIKTLSNTRAQNAPDTLLTVYDEALTRLSSLQSFAKCLGAKDVTDKRITPALTGLAGLRLALDEAASGVFDVLLALPDDDPCWMAPPFKAWHFVCQQRRNHWTRQLSEEGKRWWHDLSLHCLSPLGSVFKNLQKHVQLTVKDRTGQTSVIGPARIISVLKGDPDPVKRASTGQALEATYAEHAPLYAHLLNELHGLRLTAFDRANTDPLSVSLSQNRMSHAAFDAMDKALKDRLPKIHRAVTLRSPFFGHERMAYYDLMAPMPDQAASTEAALPYAQAIATVREALAGVNPAMSDFIAMMLDKGWLDARPDANKVGGAFYARFNEFKMPRVFTTFVGTPTSMIQQAHELGHAFHYWVMRDLPVIETEFPMTLTETASTFNEAVLRHYLFERAPAPERRRMLWQEMRSAANFMLHTMARMDFELAFLNELRSGFVDADRCVELMTQAWENRYGDTATPDKYLWAYKLHYYKTDQLIYNYPYTVGYLLSQALMLEWEKRGVAFYDFYIAALRDTGRLSVDDWIATHFKADPTQMDFWCRSIDYALKKVDLFAGEQNHSGF